MKKFFASDNYSGVHSKIMKALMESNTGHEFAYGEDTYTAQVEKEFKNIFGDVGVYMVYNGTGSNVLALEACKKRGSSVVCVDTAHIHCDETGALANITGVSTLSIKNINGKINLNEIDTLYGENRGTFHKTKPDILSITQATEVGTVYSLEELEEIKKYVKKNEMILHMDGARIANACVELGCSLKEMTGDMGVDILSFGGTKNGLMFGEVIIIFNKEIDVEFLRLRKQCLQLNSKMRYQSAQYIEYLKDNLWYQNAKNANDMAKYFDLKLRELGVEVTNKVESNALFAILPKKIIEPMQEFCYFYIWNENKNEVRFVTSFDTTKEDIDKFIEKLKELLKDK